VIPAAGKSVVPVEEKTEDTAEMQPVEEDTVQKETPVVETIEKVQEFPVPAVEEDEEKEGIPWDRKVSFKFHSTPIKSALRLLASSNNLNMVIGEGIEGAVTMNLESVTLKKALEMILHTHNCEYIVDDNIISIKPVGIAFTGGRITKVYRLKYADAVNVARVIRNIVTNDTLVEVFHPEFLNFLEAGKNRRDMNRVTVQGIRRTSTLVVTDRPEKIQEVDIIIAELDRPPVQIMIESKLVELSPNYTDKLGIDWDKTLTTQLWDQTKIGEDKLDYSALSRSTEDLGNFKMGYLSAGQYQVVLDFLKEKTDSKLVSNPRILALDNEESSISVGTTVPVPRIQRGMGGTGDMVTFEYKEVNIQLNVTPHTGENSNVTMYVNPVIEEISGWVEYEEHRAPVTDKRAVNSIVTVKDGETVVIGGLIKTQQIEVLKKVWFLGNLPLFGKLFQHKQFEDKQTDLMIFITPTILKLG
jgi:type II secretory pathway component GspD/PulD (secretin)